MSDREFQENVEGKILIDNEVSTFDVIRNLIWLSNEISWLLRKHPSSVLSPIPRMDLSSPTSTQFVAKKMLS